MSARDKMTMKAEADPLKVDPRCDRVREEGRREGADPRGCALVPCEYHSNDQLAQAWSDGFTEAHAKRVAKETKEFAELMGDG